MSENKIIELTVNPIDFKEIGSNFKEVKDNLVVMLDKYQGLVFTDENIPDAKKSRADLNKLKKAIDDKRKDVKKKCLEPYTVFEDQAKELISLVEKPSLHIDSQVKIFEDKIKSERITLVRSLFDERNVGVNLAFDKIVDAKWYNASFSKNKIMEELDVIFSRVISDLRAVESFKSDFESELKNIILSNGSMSDVVNTKNNLDIIAQKAIEANKVKEEIVAVPIVENKVKTTSPEISFNIKITCTDESRTRLKEFMVANSIKFEQIK